MNSENDTLNRALRVLDTLVLEMREFKQPGVMRLLNATRREVELSLIQTRRRQLERQIATDVR